MAKVLKFKDIFKDLDILDIYQCAAYINRNNPSNYVDYIYRKIQNGELIHIGNIINSNKPLVFKIDFINFLNQSSDFICNIDLDKYLKRQLLPNYPDELYDIHIMEILNLYNLNLSIYTMKRNLELNSIYNFRIRKFTVSKINFINFLFNHRKCGFNTKLPQNYYRQFNYPNMDENIYNTIVQQKIRYNFPIEDYNLERGYGIVRPFRFENEKNIIRRDNYIPGKEMYKPYLLK